MRIISFKIQPKTASKIFDKHNVTQQEILDVLKDDNPMYRKVGGNQSLGMGVSRSRHITIFFEYDTFSKEAEITTAYPSSKKQIKFYKKVVK